MTGKQWIEAFIKSLSEPTNLARANDPNIKDSDWTEFMVKEVMRETMGKKLDCWVACRDKDDKKNSYEYLTIDAMFFNEFDYHTPGYIKIKDRTDYDPRVLPVAVVEHENEGYGEEGKIKDKIAHCLWKLLCIRSPLRILICYHKNIEELREFLENTIRGKLAEGLTDELLVIIGNSAKNEIPWKEKTDIKEYFSIFEWKDSRLEKFIG